MSDTKVDAPQSLDGIVVAIRSPLKQYARREAIRQTWGKDLTRIGAKVVFSVASEFATCLTFDTLETRCLDRHDDLTPRAIEILRWFLSTEHSHMYMLDDDCYVSAERFAGVFDVFWDYAGHFNAPWYVSGGPGVILSKQAARIVLENLSRDDTAIGAVLTTCMPWARLGNLIHVFRPWAEQEEPKPENSIVAKHYVRDPDEMRRIHAQMANKIQEEGQGVGVRADEPPGTPGPS